MISAVASNNSTADCSIASLALCRWGFGLELAAPVVGLPVPAWRRRPREERAERAGADGGASERSAHDGTIQP